MKIAILMALGFLFAGCQSSEPVNDPGDEVQIERQEDYSREDATPTDLVPIDNDTVED